MLERAGPSITIYLIVKRFKPSPILDASPGTGRLDGGPESPAVAAP